MRGRILAAAIVLVIAIAVIWEVRKMAPPVVQPAPPPVTPPFTPPAPPTTIPHSSSFPAGAGGESIHKTAMVPLPVAAGDDGRMNPTLQNRNLRSIDKSTRVISRPVMPSIQTPPPIPYNPPPPLAPEPQEWKGNTDTTITREGQVVVKSDQQWIRFWAEHHPHEAAPDVDFSSRMVVGVFLGQRPSDGFVAEITAVRNLADAVVVDYIERAPPPGTFQIGVTAFPYDIKVIPRSSLHVKFNKLEAVYKPEVFPAKSKP